MNKAAKKFDQTFMMPFERRDELYDNPDDYMKAVNDAWQAMGPQEQQEWRQSQQAEET